MPTTLRNTDILFNDGSTQSTSAIGSGSNASAGWRYLPGGILLQWGVTSQTTGSNGTGSYLTTSFPIAFPTACWQISGSTFAPTELNNAISNNVISFTNSSFVILTQRFGGTNPRAQLSWIAIGI